jgi:hypothetical protein
MNITLNNIKSILNNFSIEHPVINNFYYGDIEGITNTNEEFIYPLLAVIPLSTTYPLNQDNDIITKQFNLQILIMDKLNNDLSNRDGILSDCQQLSEDLISYIIYNEYFYDNKISILNNVIITHFTERTTDKTAGNAFELVLTTPLNPCLTPVIVNPNNLYC